MKYKFATLAVSFIGLPSLMFAQSLDRSMAYLKSSVASLPLSFEPNLGQTDPRVQFLSRGRGYRLFLSSGEADLAFTPRDKHETSIVARDLQRLRTVGPQPSATSASGSPQATFI